MTKFKTEFEAALQSGLDDERLLEMVRDYKSTGSTQRDVYDSLQSIWLEHGYDDDDGGVDVFRDQLEYILERVWYGSGIWEDGLASQLR